MGDEYPSLVHPSHRRVLLLRVIRSTPRFCARTALIKYVLGVRKNNVGSLRPLDSVHCPVSVERTIRETIRTGRPGVRMRVVDRLLLYT